MNLEELFENKIKALNQKQSSSIDCFEKRTYTVPEIQDILSIGKNAAYRLVNSGQFKTVRVGSTIRISKKSFDAWLDSANPTDGQ